MKHTRVRWLGMSHMSVLGACWKQAESERKAIFGREGMQEERDSWKEKQHTRACMEDLTMLGLGFL
jgi:hypothetical protein